MRWLLIALLVSLAALLIAAVGGARHIWLQRRGRQRPSADQRVPDSSSTPADESDVETEIL
ncbi:MAG: hypothetical protein WAK26_17240 [Terracidiphilus sp.]|jgi:hypothetical protein